MYSTHQAMNLRNVQTTQKQNTPPILLLLLLLLYCHVIIVIITIIAFAIIMSQSINSNQNESSVIVDNPCWGGIEANQQDLHYLLHLMSQDTLFFQRIIRITVKHQVRQMRMQVEVEIKLARLLKKSLSNAI
jgi:hypothetical protein